MPDSQRPRVLVVDDDPKVLDALRRGLTVHGYEVLTSADGLQAVEVAQRERPDLVILDIMLPGLDGIEVCRRLRSLSAAPILMLTARDEVADRVQGLDAGADDYLAKPFALEELLARLRAVRRRARPEEAEVIRFADLTVDTAAREVRRGDRLLDLTPREYELLLYFLRHPRRVLTRDALLDQVWGFTSEIDTHVLEVYVGYLRQKLEAGGEPRLIHTVRGTGYILREP